MYADLGRMKVCSECNQEKAESEFYQFYSGRNEGLVRRQCKPCSNAISKEYRNRNKAKCNARQRNYYANNKHVAVAQNLRRYYGLTLKFYRQALKDQNGKCAICDAGEESTTKRRLSVDHDHETGKFRGLLCDRCNRGLGLLKDSEEVLNRAIAYLKKSKN